MIRCSLLQGGTRRDALSPAAGWHASAMTQALMAASASFVVVDIAGWSVLQEAQPHFYEYGESSTDAAASGGQSQGDEEIFEGFGI